MSFRDRPARTRVRSRAHHYARGVALSAVIVFGPMSCIGRPLPEGDSGDGDTADANAAGGHRAGSGGAGSTGAGPSVGGRESWGNGGGSSDFSDGFDDFAPPWPSDGGSLGSGGSAGETGAGGQGGETSDSGNCDEGFTMGTVCTECGGGGGCLTEWTGCLPECTSSEECADGTFCSDKICRLFCV